MLVSLKLTTNGKTQMSYQTVEVSYIFEFFLNITNLTFLAFCTKLTSKGLKISKNKAASTGN